MGLALSAIMKKNCSGVSAMRKTGKYSNYLRKSYVRYASALVLFLFLVFFIFTYFNLWYTTINANQSCNNELNRFLTEQYASYTGGISRIARSDSIRKALEGKNKTDAYRELYAFVAEEPIKCVFYVFDAKQNLVLTNLYLPNEIILQQNRKLKETLGLSESSPGQVYSGPSGIMYDNSQRTAFLFCRAVTVSEKVSGYLCFDMTEQSLNEVISRKSSVDMLALTDRFDNAFYYTSKSMLNSMGKCQLNLDDGTHSATVDDKPYYGVSTTLPDYNIRIITLSSTGAQGQVMKLGISFLCSLMVLMGFLVVMLAKKAAKNNSYAIEELLYAVQQGTNGNMGYRINSVTFDEFQTLYKKFNEMMRKIQALIKNNSELLERKRMMEVSQLEKQFNPHFVFNVLEMLKYEILIDPQQASRMVVAFAGLMRYSINNGTTRVPLSTDIGYVRDYLTLQKMRFSQRLSYHIDIEEELLGCYVPKLLIQPVVENCLSHGIENMESIEIRMTGRKTDGNIELIISDNGCGITKENLRAIRKLLNSEDIMPNHIGLYNIQRQIKLLYGEPYGLTIDSEYGRGTSVRICIPFERSDRECIKSLS